ncbi:MAG: hypothetical protein E6G33_03185 [Actinobacteria bacterium]|nr:MAG: hypothetical protein E6G33_03185 [Actinomycetota bacterium]
MLQQTQVERVVPRYLDWLERWPSADELAAAAVADVIRAWQGLGYNRRGLNLHRAAQRVATEGWPDDLTELPGVGPYTAAAIGNFALGLDVLPVDTNVSRVQERTGHRFSPAAAQALMDLGATVCLARIPRCGVSSIRSAAEAVPLRRLVPATPRADVAPRDGVGASAGRPRPRGGPVPRPGRPRPAGPLWNESHTAVTVSDTRPWDNVTGA